MNNCGRVDSRIDPYINLPLSGEVPRRGGRGTEAAFGTVLPGEASGMMRQDRRTQFAPYGSRFTLFSKYPITKFST